MEEVDRHILPSPPASAASPAPSAASNASRNWSLPTPRVHRLRPGSQKEIALINYLDDKILRITRRYAKKFSNEKKDNDDTPGYTTYDEFADDVDPLIDVVWISGTPTIQIPYLLSLAGQVCSFLHAFPFSKSFFLLAGKLDDGFASLIQSIDEGGPRVAPRYQVSTTEKVRIKSLIEETRVAAVNTVSASGHMASIQDLSEVDTDNDEQNSTSDTDDDSGEPLEAMSIPFRLSRVYKRTLELLGDSLIGGALPQYQDAAN